MEHSSTMSGQFEGRTAAPKKPEDTTSAAPEQASTVGSSAWKSPWVLAWVGLLVVVLCVNITMVVLAFVTNPGLIRSDYYERGRDIEQTIATRLAEGPDWAMQIDTPADVTVGEPTTVRFFVVDNVGQPVTPDRVTYYAYRSSDAGQDFSVPMIAGGPGRFEADVVFSLPGIWDSVVSIETDGFEFSVSSRISVAPPQHP
jgi:nitrogen fixation protein FixH